MDELQPYLDLLAKTIMDDWLIVFGGTIFFGFIIVVFYWLYNRNEESEFDTRYPRAVLQVLASDTKKKQQPTTKKNKKNKSPVAAAEQSNGIQRQPVTSNAPVAPVPKPAPAPKQSKRQQPKESSQPSELPPKPTSSDRVTVSQDVNNDEPMLQVQEVEPLHAEPSKETKKTQPTKLINSADLDQKKVMSHLSKKGDIDVAYISWLNTAFQNNETQLNNRKAETQSLDRKNKELIQRNEKLAKDKIAADARAKEEQSQRLSVAAKLQALQNRETELVRQNQASQAALQNRDQEHSKEIGVVRTRSQQVESEVTSLKGNLNKANASLRTAQQQLRDAQNHLNEQERKHQSVVAAYEADKKKTVDSVAELNKVVAYCEQEMSNAGNRFSAQDRQINSLNAAKEEIKSALQAARLALENHSMHRNEDLVKLENEQKQWQAEKEQMTEKYVRLEELIKELNSDMNEFHLYKDKQEKIVSELNQRNKSSVEELVKEKEQSQAKEADLLNQLEEMKQTLSEIRKSRDEEQFRIVENQLEIPKNAEPEAEEVFELKKTTADLGASPSTSNNSLVEELKAKNAELDEKNTELRQRNLAILEKTEAVPNQLVNTRKQVAAEIGKLTKKAFKTFNDEEAFQDWLSGAVNEIEKNMSSKTTAIVADAVSSGLDRKSSKSTSAAQTPSANEEVYRNALIGLIKELDNINRLVDKQDREHQAELAQLRAQLV